MQVKGQTCSCWCSTCYSVMASGMALRFRLKEAIEDARNNVLSSREEDGEET